MKRVALTIVATITGVVLLLQFKTQPAGAGRQVALAPVTANSPSAGSSPTPTQSTRRHSSQPSPSSSSSASSGTRSVLGQTIKTRYGPVQVKVTETAGRITNVTPVQLPSRDSHSQGIAAYAAPKLRQEAIAADSARIDVVSGATYTSDGYAQSLQSALDKLDG
jgi:uncharacterized protein with FMN-binding domain